MYVPASCSECICRFSELTIIVLGLQLRRLALTLAICLNSFMQGGYTMELCLTTYWSELKDISLSLKMTYHSIQPSTTELFFVRFCACLTMHNLLIIVQCVPLCVLVTDVDMIT